MNIWKRFSVFAMSLLLVAMLAACGGGSSATEAAPTAAAPTGAPTTGGAQGAGSCTTVDSCQKAVINVTPNQAKPGGKVMVTGTGLVANAQLKVSAGIQVPDSDVVTTASDAKGNFSTAITIRADTPDTGPTDIIIVQLATNLADYKVLKVPDKLTIIDSAAAQGAGACTTAASCQKAVVTVTPNQVKPGGKVTITVKGWMAKTQAVVSISLPTDQGQPSVAPVVPATSDAQGNLTAVLTTYPNVSPGTADVEIGQDSSGSNSIDTAKDLKVKGAVTIIQ
jgi:hypothetical protein